jgi:hypothetical protein
MQSMSGAHWFAKCGVSAVILLLACGIATAWFGSGLQLPSTTTRDGTLITLNRYAKEPIPDVALVGSSLTFRLKEEYFATPKLRNLALAGGSPVTGLEIVEQLPSNFDSHIYADRALQQFNAEDPSIAVRMNAKKIEQLIPAIERRGGRVLLFELPYSEQLEGSRSATITREIIHAQFPDPDRWLRIDYARGELRWADGVHLDERSAVIVTQSIDRALASLLGPS